MDNRPIGIFDSGLGGLTAVEALRELLPEENIVYFGDTGNCPYGTKTREELHRLTRHNLDLLASFDCKVIMAACGTVSANCGSVMDAYPIPVFNILTPSVAVMSRIEGTAPLAVLATEACIRAGVFQQKIEEAAAPSREVMGIPCQDFVSLCESGHIAPADPLLTAAVEEYLRPAKEMHVPAVLLGCTHFGIIADAIRAYLGEDTAVISASRCAAAVLAEHIVKNGLTGEGASSRFFTSGSPEAFDRMASLILGRNYAARAERVEPYKL